MSPLTKQGGRDPRKSVDLVDEARCRRDAAFNFGFIDQDADIIGRLGKE